MAFEELKENANAIQENIKGYIDTNIEYYKLWGFKVAMKSTTLLFKFFLIALCIMFILLFVSVAVSISIGRMLDSYALGFLSVAGIYLLIILLLVFVKNKFLEGKILEKFSEIFFND